jgi:DNA topoisomerase III
MGKILVIAEKPSVGRDIAKVLRCSSRGDGHLFSETHIVSWAIGHLVTLCDPEDYDDSLKKWSKSSLPIIPKEIKLKPVVSTKKQLNILKKLMNSKDIESIICATDSGREGELIFRYIYSITKCKKPFKRLWISSMTDSAIREGLANIKEGSAYNDLYKSAKCRSEADWLVGINATRAYTIKYNTLLSIGRVQTPTLALLVNRQKEIDSFVVENYYEVKATFREYTGIWFDSKSLESKILDKNEANAIVDKIIGNTGEISNITTEQKKQPHGLLYDLTELQRDCNRKFGFSAKKTLTIAQDLYEKSKLITYPRTDSRYLSDDLVPKLKIVLKRLQETTYESYANYILSLPKLPITKRIVDSSKVSDHHAIIPTESKINMTHLSGDHLKVYDIVVRKFLSVFYPIYIYELTKITTNVLDELFITKGTMIIQLGFMEVLKSEKPKKNEDEQVLPIVSKGDTTEVSNCELLSKKTKPPKTYNEATLLSAMENPGKFIEDEDIKEQLKDSGLGTAATRASIIERIIDVGYVIRKGKSLIPTEKGMKLISIVPSELGSPETTGRWERGLASIAKGSMSTDKFSESINKYVNYIINCSSKSPNDVVFPDEVKNYKDKGNFKAIAPCPKCNDGEVLENTKAYYCSNWKKNCKFTIWKNSVESYGIELSLEIIKKLVIDKKVVGIKLTLPQTNEKCIADLVMKQELSGGVELINLDRI